MLYEVITSAARSLDEPLVNLRPLLETILEFAPAPVVDVEAPLQFQAVTLGYDDYIGRLVIGRFKTVCGAVHGIGGSWTRWKAQAAPAPATARTTRPTASGMPRGARNNFV